MRRQLSSSRSQVSPYALAIRQSIRKGSRIERTHDFDRLGQIATVQGIEDLLDICDTPTVFAVNGCYPGDLPEVSISAVRNYFESAGRVHRELLTHIHG